MLYGTLEHYMSEISNLEALDLISRKASTKKGEQHFVMEIAPECHRQ